MSIDVIDTTVLIWDYLFKVRMPYIQSRSIEELRMYGVTLSGVPEMDNDINNQWITTVISIDKMIEHFSEGTPIKIVNKEDVKTIYEYISRHINVWKQELTEGLNIGGAPIEDLILMDRFANTVYEHAKYQFTPEMANSLISQHASKIQRINASNLFKAPDAPIKVTSPEKEESPYPERTSMSEFFRDKLVSIRRY